ncbi:hypothetical protein SAMN02927924_00090 [Sphingobium faniae]|nr:hypothetical protein SAMN02927924_00090 [Sphingobium faniae]
MSFPIGLLWIGGGGAVASMALLRHAWGKPSRSVPLNLGAWATLLAALLCGMADSGAWGMAVVTLAALAAAFLCLAHAALAAPPGRQAASNRRVRMLPEGAEPLRLGARFLTFALTVPGACLTALAIALAARAVAGRIGLHDADGNVLMLFLMPLLWMLLVMLLLFQDRRRAQLLWLSLPALASLLILAATGTHI